MKAPLRFPPILIQLAALCLAVATAPGREFTDNTGRKIQGDLIAHGGGSVEIKIGNNTFGIPIDKFAEADQAHIREWIAANPNATAYRIRLFTNLKAVTQQRSSKDGVMVTDKLKSVPYEYFVTVYNQSKLDMPDAEIRYEIYINDVVDTNGNRYAALAVGEKKADKLQTIPGKVAKRAIPAGGKVEFKHTFPTEIYVDRDGGRVDQAASDKVIGIRARVYVDGKLAGEAGDAEDQKRFESAPWQDAPAGEETVPLK